MLYTMVGMLVKPERHSLCTPKLHYWICIHAWSHHSPPITCPCDNCAYCLKLNVYLIRHVVRYKFTYLLTSVLLSQLWFMNVLFSDILQQLCFVQVVLLYCLSRYASSWIRTAKHSCYKCSTRYSVGMVRCTQVSQAWCKTIRVYHHRAFHWKEQTRQVHRRWWRDLRCCVNFIAIGILII